MLVQLPNGEWVNPAYVSGVRLSGGNFDGTEWIVKICMGSDPKQSHGLLVKGTLQDAENFRDDWAETLNVIERGKSS